MNGQCEVAPVLRQNLVTIDIVDFLQPRATLYGDAPFCRSAAPFILDGGGHGRAVALQSCRQTLHLRIRLCDIRSIQLCANRSRGSLQWHHSDLPLPIKTMSLMT